MHLLLAVLKKKKKTLLFHFNFFKKDILRFRYYFKYNTKIILNFDGNYEDQLFENAKLCNRKIYMDKNVKKKKKNLNLP